MGIAGLGSHQQDWILTASSNLPESLGEGPNTVRGARPQTPNSVSYLALIEFQGGNSLSFSQSSICAQSELTRLFTQHRVCPKLSEFSLLASETVLSKEAVFHPFPKEPFLENQAAGARILVMWIPYEPLHPCHLALPALHSGRCLLLVGACLATGDRIFATGSDSVSKMFLRSCGCFCFQGRLSWFERAPDAQNILR